jgi:hypothetical protein
MTKDIKDIERLLGIKYSSKYSLISWSTLNSKFLSSATKFISSKKPTSALSLLLTCFDYVSLMRHRFGKTVLEKPLNLKPIFKVLGQHQAVQEVDNCSTALKPYSITTYFWTYKKDVRLTYDRRHILITKILKPLDVNSLPKFCKILLKTLRLRTLPKQLREGITVSVETLVGTPSVKFWFKINNLVFIHRSRDTILIRCYVPVSNLISPVMYLNNVKHVDRHPKT